MATREIRSIYLCGLGAVGCSYTKAFQQHLPEGLKILADEARRYRYKQEGVWVNGERLEIDFVEPNDDAADLIIVTVKQHDLADAIELIAPYVGEKTIILSFLNGIESEEIIGRHERIGIDRLLYSFVVETDAVKVGNQITFTKSGVVVFGEKRTSEGSDRVQAVRELLEHCQIRYRVPADMLKELWWKFMMNVGANQISAVLRCGYGGLAKSKPIQRAMRLACGEVLPLAALHGVSLSEKDIEEYFAVFARLDPRGKTSMLQDVEAQRVTEVELFSGTVRRLGRQLGVATPVNDLLYELIQALTPAEQQDG